MSSSTEKENLPEDESQDREVKKAPSEEAVVKKEKPEKSDRDVPNDMPVKKKKSKKSEEPEKKSKKSKGEKSEKKSKKSKERREREAPSEPSAIWSFGASVFSSGANLISSGKNMVGSGLSSVGNVLTSADMLYRVTKQMVLESVTASKTLDDPELQAKIDRLHEIKSQYEDLVKLGNVYCNNFDILADSMANLGNHVYKMSLQEKGTARENIIKVADSYRITSKNEQPFVQHLRSFCDKLTMFKEKALDDTFETVKKYEEVRFLYEVYANKMKQMEGSEGKAAYEELRNEFEIAKRSYIQVRSDLNSKIDMLMLKRQNDLETQMGIQYKNMIAFHQQNLDALLKLSAKFEKKDDLVVAEKTPSRVQSREELKVEPPKPESPKLEPPKPEPPKPESPKPEHPKPDPPKEEPVKQEEAKEEQVEKVDIPVAQPGEEKKEDQQ